MRRQSTGATFITRLAPGGDGTRIALKDVVDLAGVPTTAGCRAVADSAGPAERDAPCLTGARAAGARFVGKANLHELGFGVSGVNPWYGTPVNPVAPDLVPGGSSSGPAVAVGTDEADLAYGTDTGGSVRIPAACCGVTGLKTTFGRIPVEGVSPLAPSMDSVGPLAPDIARLRLGMQLLDPALGEAGPLPTAIGRLRLDALPAVDEALDRALREAGFEVVDIRLGWDEADEAGRVILLAEVWETLGHLAVEHPEGLGTDTRRRFDDARAVPAAARAEAEAIRVRWRAELARAFERVAMFALPTLVAPPSRLGEASAMHGIRRTTAANVAGVPALSMPVPAPGLPVPASLQLVGPWGSEADLLAVAAVVEAAVS
ncbi:MAG: amidase [Acidimicrobiia bacterium]